MLWKTSSLLSLLLSLLLLLIERSRSSPQNLHFCHRGFCYTHRASLQPRSSSSRTSSPRKGLYFCSTTSSIGCELYQILGEEADLEECTSDECDMLSSLTGTEPQVVTLYTTMSNGEVMEVELIDTDASIRESDQEKGKEEPQQGRCYDNQLHYEFDCLVMDMKADGIVLIEDLGAGGVFAAQPKSTRRKSKQEPRTPSVMKGSGIVDWNEDFRVNISLNLEGL